MAAIRNDWEDWEERMESCLETVRESDDYAAQLAALRTIGELAAEAEEQLANERFIGK